MKKILRYVGVALLIFILCIAIYIGYQIARVEIPAEWYKVTDPTDPDFDPYNFKFTDYDGCPNLNNVFKEIFHVGMPKAEVDKILIHSGGAKCGGPNKTIPEFYYCRKPLTYKNWDGIAPNFSLLFDSDLRLLNMKPCASMSIFENSMTYQDIKKTYELKLNQEKSDEQ
jgi:hypothetical protein